MPGEILGGYGLVANLGSMADEPRTRRGPCCCHQSGSCPDTEIIARARRDGRIVMTADLDYPRLLALSAADGPAVILFRGGDWKESQTIDRLSAAMSLIPEDEPSKSLVVIEKSRIRRRALPL